METIIKDEKDGRLEIIQRGQGIKWERELFLAIQEAFESGYRFPEEAPELIADCSFRNYQGTIHGKAVLFKESEDEETINNNDDTDTTEIQSTTEETIIDTPEMADSDSITEEKQVVEKLVKKAAPKKTPAKKRAASTKKK